MLPQIKIFEEIQVLDQEALQLKDQMARYPAIWEEVKKRLAKAKEDHDRAVAARERQLRDRKRVEQKLRLFSDDLRRYQTQQKEIKNSKEYEAVNKQIETVKKKIGQAEEQGLGLIEKEPQLEKDEQTTCAEVKKLKELARKEKERIRVQFNEKKERLATVEGERDKLRAAAAPEHLEIYDRVFVRYPGNALASVRNNSCTGCHWQLLPDMLVKLHGGQDLLFCTNCGRILTEDEDYVPGEEESAV